MPSNISVWWSINILIGPQVFWKRAGNRDPLRYQSTARLRRSRGQLPFEFFRQGKEGIDVLATNHDRRGSTADGVDRTKIHDVATCGPKEEESDKIEERRPGYRVCGRKKAASTRLSGSSWRHRADLDKIEDQRNRDNACNGCEWKGYGHSSALITCPSACRSVAQPTRFQRRWRWSRRRHFRNDRRSSQRNRAAQFQRQTRLRSVRRGGANGSFSRLDWHPA